MGVIAAVVFPLFDRTAVGKIFFGLAFITVVLRVANLSEKDVDCTLPTRPSPPPACSR